MRPFFTDEYLKDVDVNVEDIINELKKVEDEIGEYLDGLFKIKYGESAFDKEGKVYEMYEMCLKRGGGGCMVYGLYIDEMLKMIDSMMNEMNWMMVKLFGDVRVCSIICLYFMMRGSMKDEEIKELINDIKGSEGCLEDVNLYDVCKKRMTDGRYVMTEMYLLIKCLFISLIDDTKISNEYIDSSIVCEHHGNDEWLLPNAASDTIWLNVIAATVKGMKGNVLSSLFKERKHYKQMMILGTLMKMQKQINEDVMIQGFEGVRCVVEKQSDGAYVIYDVNSKNVMNIRDVVYHKERMKMNGGNSKNTDLFMIFVMLIFVLLSAIIILTNKENGGDVKLIKMNE